MPAGTALQEELFDGVIPERESHCHWRDQCIIMQERFASGVGPLEGELPGLLWSEIQAIIRLLTQSF